MTPLGPSSSHPYFPPVEDSVGTGAGPGSTSASASGESSGPPFWLGVLAGVLSPVILGVLGGLLGDAATYLPLLSLVGVVALVAHPRTRRFGLGTLLGVGILLIIAAGACIALIAVIAGNVGG